MQWILANLRQRILRRFYSLHYRLGDKPSWVLSFQHSLLQLLVDGTTNAGNVEDEIIVILYHGKDDVAGEI